MESLLNAKVDKKLIKYKKLLKNRLEMTDNLSMQF